MESNLEIYTIFDKKAETYMRPMYTPHIVEIQRSLTANLKDKTSTLSQFPEDYSLFKLGTYDIKSAIYKLHENPTFIMNITEMMIDANTPKPEVKL